MSKDVKEQTAQELEQLHKRIAELEARDIARQQAEDASRENQANLKALIENTDDAIWSVDNQFRLIVGNSAFQKNVRAAGGRELAPGDSVLSEDYPADERAYWRAIYERVMCGEHVHLERQSTRFKDEARIMDYQFGPILGPDDNVIGITVIGRDVTSYKRVEQALRESEDRFKSIYSQSPVGVELYDANGKLVDANPACLAIFGIDHVEEVLGFDLFSDPNITLSIREKLGQGKPAAFETLFDFDLVKKLGLYKTRRSGQCFVECVATPLLSSANSILGFVAHVREITERKQIQLALEQSEKRFRALIEHSTDAISLIDANARVMYESPSVSLLTGYTQEERLGKSGLSLIYEEDLPVIKSIFAHVVERAGHIERAQFRSVRKDGTLWWTEASAVNLLHEPSVRAIVVNYRDITERKQAEEALREANKQLNARVAVIETLQSELREQALRDPLTGLYNRRYLNDALNRELARVKRERKSMSIIVMDIDHFKKINDTYGHQVGDEFLVKIAELIGGCTRTSDIACRYGGEEFLLVLPGTTSKLAAKRAEEIRLKCNAICILYGNKTLSVSLSLGVATYPRHGKEAEEVVIKADKAMYRSKRTGRNRVTIWNNVHPSGE